MSALDKALEVLDRALPESESGQPLGAIPEGYERQEQWSPAIRRGEAVADPSLQRRGLEIMEEGLTTEELLELYASPHELPGSIVGRRDESGEMRWHLERTFDEPNLR